MGHSHAFSISCNFSVKIFILFQQNLSLVDIVTSKLSLSTLKNLPVNISGYAEGILFESCLLRK